MHLVAPPNATSSSKESHPLTFPLISRHLRLILLSASGEERQSLTADTCLRSIWLLQAKIKATIHIILPLTVAISNEPATNLMWKSNHSKLLPLISPISKRSCCQLYVKSNNLNKPKPKTFIKRKLLIELYFWARLQRSKIILISLFYIYYILYILYISCNLYTFMQHFLRLLRNWQIAGSVAVSETSVAYTAIYTQTFAP